MDKLLVETVSIRDCVDLDDLYWSGLIYTESNKAYEIYVNTESLEDHSSIANDTYVLDGDSLDHVIKDFKDLLKGLREGLEGRLIFQSRMKPEIYKREDGRFELCWRGKLAEIPRGCNAMLLSLL